MNFISILSALLIIIIAYFMGSVPTGVWYTQIVHQKDIRKFGSGNSGTTNVGRNFGLKAAVVVAIVDVLKGLIPTLLAGRLFSESPWVMMLAAIAAIIGHAYPIFADFKGGKVVATSIGVLLAINFGMALVQVIMLFGLLYLSSIMSFSALLSYGAVAIYLILSNPYISVKIGFIIIFGLMVYRHKDNLQRLIAGNERQLNWGLHLFNNKKD